RGDHRAGRKPRQRQAEFCQRARDRPALPFRCGRPAAAERGPIVSNRVFSKAFSITGDPPANRVAILQFENMDKVKAWRDVARDAQEKIGNKYATFRTFALEGVAQY